MFDHVQREEPRGEGVQRGQEREDDRRQPAQIEGESPGPDRLGSSAAGAGTSR